MRSISHTFALALLVALSGCASLPTDVARVSSSHTDRDGQPSRFETLARFDTVARRMRNKSFTIDNVMTNVGGRNVGDEYFGAHEGVNFGDMDVLAVGPAAAEVGTQFDLYWNSALAYPVRSRAALATSTRCGVSSTRTGMPKGTHRTHNGSAPRSWYRI
jgi:phosphatidylserine/phosphatidylglycerophosphate/cardiolipin synthase-like enzyme